VLALRARLGLSHPTGLNALPKARYLFASYLLSCGCVLDLRLRLDTYDHPGSTVTEQILGNRAQSNGEAYQMAEQIVSRRGEIYVSTRNGRKVAEGETQNEAGYNGMNRFPEDVILAQRQRDTENGVRDELRRLYPHKE